MDRLPNMILSVVALMAVLFNVSPASTLTARAQTMQELGLRLVATVVSDEKGKSIAVIDVRDTGEEITFREGDLWREARVKRIDPGSVLFTVGKRDFVLAMRPIGERSEEAAADQPVHLDRRDVRSELSDSDLFMREIHVRPRFEGGLPAGFIIYSIAPESIFDRMGLRDGDVIVGINGIPLTGTQPAIDFYETLRKGGRVSLQTIREDEKRDLYFEIQ